MADVAEAPISLQSPEEEGEEKREDKGEEEAPVIRCDTCMEAEAARTCLTCMASYCEEHLRPHRENPVFRPHQLAEPVGDLAERVCPHHHKLLELFCRQHGSPVCSLCLQQGHRACSFCSPEEQRRLRESDLREKLALLEGKIERTDRVLLRMTDLHSKLQEGAEGRRAALAGVYQQVRELLAQDEGAARLELDRQLGLQLEAAQNRIRDLTKRFTDNSQRMRRAREELTGLLSRSQTMAFLQASYELPKVVNFDPYTPRVSLDSEKLAVIQGSASALRAGLVALLAQPLEARVPLLRPELGPDAAAGGGQDGSTSGPERAVSQPEIANPAQRRSRAQSPGRPPPSAPPPAGPNAL
ncbi:E3 ubiquitin/ISG15 ligase TRIM25-like [Menidia menidia]